MLRHLLSPRNFALARTTVFPRENRIRRWHHKQREQRAQRQTTHNYPADHLTTFRARADRTSRACC